MKKIKILLFLFLFLFVSFNAYAIEGSLNLEYDLKHGTGMAEINLSKEIYEDLTLGLQFTTYLERFGLKEGWMPAGQPESQFYRGYLKYKINNNISVWISNQCRHFFSMSNIEYWNDTGTIVIGGQYSF